MTFFLIQRWEHPLKISPNRWSMIELMSYFFSCNTSYQNPHINLSGLFACFGTRTRRKISLISLFLFASTISINSVLAGPVVTIPLEVNDGIPFVRLTINQHEQRFVLDSGTMTAIHLTRDVADTLPNLSFTGGKVKSFDLAGNLSEVDEFVISELTVNGIPFRDVKGVIFSPWGFGLGDSAAPPTDTPVLGLRFFENKKVLFDFSKRTMAIGDESAFPIADFKHWTALPFDLTSEGLVVVFPSAKHRYKLVLDTAATISMIRASKVRAHGDLIQQCAYDLGSTPCEYVTISMPQGSLLQALLVDLPEQFKADGIVGSDFFLKTSILLDFQNKLIFTKEHSDERS